MPNTIMTREEVEREIGAPLADALMQDLEAIRVESTKNGGKKIEADFGPLHVTAQNGELK